MTKQMPPEPDLENHTDEQLDRLDRAISDALTEGLADIARGSSDLSAKDLVSVHDALKQARLGDWVDSGGLNRALELLVKTVVANARRIERACGPDLGEVVRAMLPDEDDPRVTGLTATWLANGSYDTILEALAEAQRTIKRMDRWDKR